MKAKTGNVEMAHISLHGKKLYFSRYDKVSKIFNNKKQYTL